MCSKLGRQGQSGKLVENKTEDEKLVVFVVCTSYGWHHAHIEFSEIQFEKSNVLNFSLEEMILMY